MELNLPHAMPPRAAVEHCTTMKKYIIVPN